MSFKMEDFRHQNVPGLYSYTHFEHPNGAFIQVRHCGRHFVYQDAEGKRHEFNSHKALALHVEGSSEG